VTSLDDDLEAEAAKRCVCGQPSYAELTERLIKASSERDHALRILRSLGEAEGDRSLGALLLSQQAQIAILEANVNRLVDERRGKAKAA
jgi:hypothetical protein